MIRFALACTAHHAFEGWFAGSTAFDDQRSARLILCPVCGSAEVDKALMTPAVSTTRRADPVEREPAKREVVADSVRVAAPSAETAEVVATLRKMRKSLTENAEYVGDRFAAEARRIHYDEVEKRGIYGEATRDEVKSLADEGIGFHPLPVLPEDHN